MNQAEAKSGASSIACSSRSAAAGEIALQLQIAREIEPAVGNQIAGGQEQARGHWGTDSGSGWRVKLERHDRCLYTRNAPARHPDARCRRPVLQARRLPHRSGAAGRARRDHPWPFRPCPARPWRGAGDPGNARHDAAALWRQFCRQHAGDRLWRRDQARRRHGQISSRRPCAGLGADRGLLQGHLHRRLGRLQGRAGSDLHAVRGGAVRRLHHRGDVWPAGVPARRCGGRGEEAAGVGGAVSGARASGRRLFARQGAARDRAAARGRLRRADLSAWRDGEDHAITIRAAASRSASCARSRA